MSIACGERWRGGGACIRFLREMGRQEESGEDRGGRDEFGWLAIALIFFWTHACFVFIPVCRTGGRNPERNHHRVQNDKYHTVSG